MSKIAATIQRIKEERVGQTGKRLLLVEGSDDVTAFSIFLEKVLWSVINPLWSGLRALGFKEALLDVDKAQDDTVIQTILNEWHKFLEPQQIFEAFQTLHATVNTKEVSEQLHRWIHGKLFYQSVVHPALDQLLGQKTAEERRLKIFRTRTLPDDLAPLWAMLGL
jgi:hypothetical protein